MKNKNWKIRALRTFIQAAVGYLAINVPMVDFGSGWDICKKGLIGLGVSTVAAGIAAVMNFIDEENKRFE